MIIHYEPHHQTTKHVQARNGDDAFQRACAIKGIDPLTITSARAHRTDDPPTDCTDCRRTGVDLTTKGQCTSCEGTGWRRPA